MNSDYLFAAKFKVKSAESHGEGFQGGEWKFEVEMELVLGPFAKLKQDVVIVADELEILHAGLSDAFVEVEDVGGEMLVPFGLFVFESEILVAPRHNIRL